jgi:hypothetical protein
MNAPCRGASAIVAAVLVLSACGETYIESSATTAPAGAPVVTYAPVPVDATVDELLGAIETLMYDLDERIIADNAPAATLDRIEELWALAEPQIRDADLDAVYPFEQALGLARSGVARNRPADASKGYKIMQQVSAAYRTDPESTATG